MPADGESLVRTRYLSLDPYMRSRISDAESYAKPVEIGEPMEGETVAEVIESRRPEYRPGNLVQARIGWRTHAAISVASVRRVNPGFAPITTALGVLGMPGFSQHDVLLFACLYREAQQASVSQRAPNSAKHPAGSIMEPAPVGGRSQPAAPSASKGIHPSASSRSGQS